ncbi:MAG: glycosyltransferase family 39 protein [Flavobacteriales bacterium]|nr:glycosyltransferase family 39 protein [Flavobacteriales bacterium]
MQKILSSRFRNEYVIASIGIILFAIIQLLGFNGLYGQDSYQYVQYCTAWTTYFAEGNHPGDYQWPLNYPINGALLAHVFGMSTTTALQMLSLLALIGNGILLNRLINVLFPKINRNRLVWVIIGFIFVPYVMRTGLVAMSDQYASFLSLLAFYATIKVVKQGKHWWVLGLVVFGSLAVMTRYICALMILPMGIYILPYLWKNRVWLPSLVAAGIGLLPFLPHYFIRIQNLVGFVDHAALYRWSIGNMFSRTFESNSGQFKFTLPNVLYIFRPFVHVGFLFFGGVLVLFIRRLKLTKELVLIGVISFGFLFFIAGIDTQNDRYFVTVMPFISLLVYPLFNGLIEWIENRSKRLVIPGILVLLVARMSLAGYAFLRFYQINLEEQQLALLFDGVEGKTVYTYGSEMMLSNYNKNNTFLTLHEQEGLDPDSGTLFLFNKAWVNHSQVKGLFHVTLWKELNQAGRLTSLDTLNEWVLYEVN